MTPPATESTWPQSADVKMNAGLNVKIAAAANAQASVAKRRTMTKTSAASTRSMTMLGSLMRALSVPNVGSPWTSAR